MTLPVSSASQSCRSPFALGQEFQAYKYALSKFSGVALVDLQGKILEINNSLCRLLGYDCSELIGRSYSQFASHLSSDADAQQLWEAIADGQPWHGEIRHCDRSGNYHWLETNVIPLEAATGQIDRYLFTSQDLTEQRKITTREHHQRKVLLEQRALNKALQIRLDGNNDILNLIVKRAPLSETLGAIAELTERLASNLHCAVMVVDPMSGCLVHQAAPSLSPEFIETMDDLPITPQGGAFAAAAHSQRTIIVPDIAADLQAHYVNDVALQHELRSYWATPILVRGKVVAVFGMYYSQPQYPSETDQRLMTRAVELTQVAMERHRSETALHNKLEQTLLLGQITQEIRQSLDIQEVFQTAVTQLRKLLQADRVAISRIGPCEHAADPNLEPNTCSGQDSADREANCFIAEDVVAPFGSILGLPHSGQNSSTELKPDLLDATAQTGGTDTSGTASLTNAPLLPNPHDPTTPKIVEDIYYSQLEDEQIALMEALEIQASMAVPIMASQGQAEQLQQSPWGMLHIQQCSSSRQWQESEISFVQALAVQLSIAIQQAALLSQAQQKSDRLQQLLETVQRQKQQQARVAERERVVSRVIQQIHKTRDIAKILATTTQEARTLLRCDRVLIYRFLPDWHREIAHESCAPNCPPLKQTPHRRNWVDHSLQQNQGGRYRNGESAVVADIYDSDYSDEHVQCFSQQNIRAFIVVPIFVGEQLWGLMGGYQQNTPRNWKFEDLSCLERISGQLGVAFQQAELLKQLKAAKEKADSANQAKGTFLAHMSHELRTPLNAILGFSQLMHRDPVATQDQKEKLNTINRSGAHLLSLINDVLDMSKIEAGSMVLNEADFNLQNLCDSIYEMFLLKAKSKGLALKLEWDESVPANIHGDERKLRQVLMNLVSNSLKFTHQGGITVKIWKGKAVRLNPMTSLSNAPVELNFSVSDTGQGIVSQEMGQLFEAFSQTESGRQAQEGTGLGLPISREFVELMGGHLTLESEVQQGTTAAFSIVVPPVVGQLAQAPRGQRVSKLAPAQQEYRLLVVEDRLENRTLLTQLLECVGFSVRTAEHGEAAIAQWKDWKPHLIWMDLQMPVMDGFEATRQIRLLEAQQRAMQASAGIDSAASAHLSPLASSRAHAELGFVPAEERETYILAITASAFEETRTLTLEAGFDDFIRKPFEENLIFDKISQYLGARYCYESAVTQPETPTEAIVNLSEPQQHNLQQQCQAMGKQWQAELHRAAINLDEDWVQRLINAIAPEHESLKITLQNWGQSLRLDKIAELLQTPFEDST